MIALRHSVFLLVPGILSLLILIYFYFFSKLKAVMFAGATLIAAISALTLLKDQSQDQAVSVWVSLLCAFGVAIFVLTLLKMRRERYDQWQNRAQTLETLLASEENKGKELKSELEKLENEIVRTVRVYAAIKGLGEALSWNEMIPHIDYALQQCIGLKDYQLYLLDETEKFQKALSRGTRLVPAPLDLPSRVPRRHQISQDTYFENPIYQGNSQIGILWARMTPAQAQASDEKFLSEASDLSEELVMGLQKARLFSSLERLSRIDGLTGTYRRQIFDEHLLDEIRRAKAFRTTFSLLIADLDHFKNINDTFGHQAGDEVLRRVGGILKESVYETDFVARYGGEEFIVLFPQADPQGVLRKAQSIGTRIAQENFVLGWHRINVTISMGIAHFPRDGSDPSELLQTADRSLYAAKESGRNRVVDSSHLK